MIKKGGLVFFVVFLLVLPFTAHTENFTIRFSHVVSKNSPKGRAISYFKNTLEKRTKGRIKVKVYPAGILLDDVAAVGAVKNNIIQMASPAFSKLGLYIRDFQVFDIPYLFKNKNEIHNAYSGKIGNILKEKSLSSGFRLLSFWDNGFKVITNNSHPISSPEDMKNLIFRTMGSEVLALQFQLCGAIAYSYPFSNVYELLKEGVVDGQENTFNNIYSQKIHEVQRYMTISDHGYLGYAVIVSSKFWEKLPVSDRKLIKDVLRQTTDLEYTLAAKQNFNDYYRIKNDTSAKIKIKELDVEEKNRWKKYFKDHYDEFSQIVSDDIFSEALKLN
ncbi:TRAP transporter substrate-binding protein [Flexistipes sinusarabici]|uniref:TRAP transporter substrate-binding protein n=1 Tax=Flexistipes sinusarabici TaxID=2352 RepID=UPI0026F25852|nr:TRAP transporter substrate-binding protein [Flexistipes sinusarabici]